MTFPPKLFAHQNVTLRLQNYGSHPYPVVDPHAVDSNFQQQHTFNLNTAASIEDIYKKLEVLNWVAEHYPEILAQREAQKQWVQAMEGGPVCETTQK